MKEAFDFESFQPPVLTEAMLRQEQELRQQQWQTALLALGCILSQAVLVVLGYAAMDWYPWLTVSCFGYVILSTTLCGALSVVSTQKGGYLL